MFKKLNYGELQRNIMQCVAYVDHLTRWATDNRYNLAYTNAIDLLAKARANGIQVFYNDGKNVPQPGFWNHSKQHSSKTVKSEDL